MVEAVLDYIEHIRVSLDLREDAAPITAAMELVSMAQDLGWRLGAADPRGVAVAAVCICSDGLYSLSHLCAMVDIGKKTAGLRKRELEVYRK